MTTARPHPDDATRIILDQLSNCEPIAHIEQQLNARPGPNGQPSTLALCLAIAILANGNSPYTHGAACEALEKLPLDIQQRLGLPTQRTGPRDTDRVCTLTYDQVVHRFSQVHTQALKLYDDLNEFVAACIKTALPEHVATTVQNIVIDGTFLPTNHASRRRQELLDDPNCDADYQRRDKGNPDDNQFKTKQGPGYLLQGSHYYDPYDETVSPYILAFDIAPGSAHEGKVSAQLLEQVTINHPILDLVVVDGVMGGDPDFHEAVRKHHGDVIFRPTNNQQNAIVQHPLGFILWQGRVLPAGTDIDMLATRPDGTRWTPNRVPRAVDYKNDPDGHQAAITEWLNLFARIDRHARRHITRPTLDRTFRIDATPTELDRLHGHPPPPPDQPTTTTIRASDFRLNTWQPFPYGTAEWLHLHAAARSRNESGMGDLRNRTGLRGGPDGIRIRGRTRWKLLGAVHSLVRNLQFSNILIPNTGRIPKRTSNRKIRTPKAALTRLHRELRRRNAARQQIADALTATGPNQPTANAPPDRA